VSWVKLSDTFAEDPKIIGLTDRSFRAHVSAMCYCARHATDGVVPSAIAATFPAAAIAGLTAAGVWESLPLGDYLIHDWLEYNPSRAQIKAKRAAASNASRKRWGDAESNAERNASGIADGIADSIDTALGVGDGSGQLRGIPPDRPDEDQVYLAARIEETWGKPLGIPALQRLNTKFGRVLVTQKLRELHGFPPAEAVRSPYAYLIVMCKSEVVA
jgi:hypothetical protein